MACVDSFENQNNMQIDTGLEINKNRSESQGPIPYFWICIYLFTFSLFL